MYGPDEIVVAARNFTSAWANYGAYDNACHMTQTEMEAMAWLFTVTGEPQSAAGLMEAWIEAEIEDGECVRGDYEVVDTINGPTLVDHRPDEPSPFADMTNYEITMGLDN
jgi:hypothetical protein